MSECYDGRSGAELTRLLDLPRVEVYRSTASTQDVAHQLAEEGAPAGTLVIAEEQTAGRGRGANAWQSASGFGVWFTLIERPHDSAAASVLSLRLALAIAPVLERWTRAPVRIKWPNDLLVAERKLAGLLTEARWRGTRLDWIAIGVGINTMVPPDLHAAALEGVTDRAMVLGEILPAIRAAASRTGVLSPAELAAYAERDGARGRRSVQPVPGVVRGVTPDGALIIQRPDGEVAVRSGSLVLEAHS